MGGFDRQHDLGFEAREIGKRFRDRHANSVIKKIYEKVDSITDNAPEGKIINTYKVLREFADGLEHNMDDVQGFIDLYPLEKLDGMYFHQSVTSLMASALLNKLSEGTKRLTLYIDTFGKYSVHLGYMHSKNTIRYEGSVGPYFGMRMKGGKQIVRDNAGNLAGTHMEGGTIIIEHAADECLGMGMKGGIIEAVMAADNVGDGMHGGIIHVKECLSVSSDRHGGEVYVDGILIPIGKENEFGL